MLISTAFAQAAGGGGGGSLFVNLAPLLLIFAVFYFLLIRPQQRKAKAHREMLGQVRRGDRVLTGGGIIGTVTRVMNDREVAVEIAEGVKVVCARATLTDVLTRPEPAKAKSNGGAGSGGQKEPAPQDIGSAVKGMLGGFLGGKK